MNTACFFLPGLDWRDSRVVSVARWQPKRYLGRVYLDLAPPAALLRRWKAGKLANWAEYERAYREEVLARLDPAAVVRDLGEEAILCCFEPAGRNCHRQLVARWLETRLGLVVPELRAIEATPC